MDFERFTAPRTARVVEGQSVDQAVRDALRDPILEHYAEAELDGVTIARDLWPTLILKAGQTLRVALRPRGETGRKVLRTVLLIAVVAVAAWITAGAGGALIASSFTASALAAGFAAVASLAINALIPPPSAGTGSGEDVDPTYSLTGTRNQMRPNQPVPVPLGSHRYVPDLITEQYQEVVGDDIWLRFGVCWGAGPYEVDDLRIGETPIGEFDGIDPQHQLLPSAPPQTLIRGDFTQDAVGATLDTDWVTRRTAADAADAEIMLQFPRGLGTQDDKGKPQSVGVTVQVRVRVVEDDDSVGDWSDLGTDDPIIADRVADGLGVDSREDLFDLGGFGGAIATYDQYLIGLGGQGAPTLSRTYRRSDIKPFAAKLSIALPPGKRFDISVRRTTAPDTTTTVADQAVWAILTTFQTSPVVAEPILATSFFRIKASDQLSGQISELNGLLHRLAPTYTGPSDPGLAAASDWDGPLIRTINPADCLLDAMQGLHTVTPTPDDEIHWGDLAAFWLWCDDNNFTFSLPMGGGETRGDALDTIARTGRARIYRHNGKIRIAIDRPRTEGPAQVLTPRNARNFNFTRTFAPPVHALRLPFTNAQDDHRDDEVIAYAEGYGPDTATLIETVPAPGMLYADQVHGYGQYLLAQMAARTLTARCDMDIEFETLKLGDYVRLAHPVLDATALSARVFAVDGRTIELDTDHNFDPAQSYVLRHRRKVEEGGSAYLECAGLYPLTAQSGWSYAVTLVDDLPVGVTIEADDLVTIGIAGQDSFEGLIRDIEPSGPNEASVELVAYLPSTLINPPASDHVPRGVAPFRPVPSPTLVGVTLSETEVSVAFDLPASADTGRITRFEVRSRVLPDPETGETGAWSRQADLPADARTVSAPIDAPDQAIEVEITTIDRDDRRSAPLRVESGSDAPTIPAPANPVLTPGTTGGASGSLVPVLDVAVDPVDTTRLASLVVESRPADTDDDWTIVATASSAQARARVLGLPPGALLDIRLAWQTPRGVLTPVDIRPVIEDVQIPDSLVATGVGDLTADDILDRIPNITAAAISEVTDGLAVARSGVGNIIDTVRGTTATAVADVRTRGNFDFSDGFTGWISDGNSDLFAPWPTTVTTGELGGFDDDGQQTTFSKDQAANIAAVILDGLQTSRTIS